MPNFHQPQMKVNIMINQNSPFNNARAAGIAYISLVILGVFPQFFVRMALTIPGDASATIANITASEFMYRMGFMSDLLLLIADMMLAFFLFYLFNPVNKKLSMLAFILNLIRVPMMGVNLLNHYKVLQLTSGQEYLSVFTTDQLNALALQSLEAHAAGYTLTGIFFGAWCLVIGYLAYKSGFFPKIVGILMMLACVTHWSEVTITFMFPDLLSSTLQTITSTTAIGEIIFCLWLLIMGGQVHRKYIEKYQPAG